MGEQMDYVQFQKCMKEQLAGVLPIGYQPDIQKIVKNNDLQLDSLVIYSEDVKISPNFYLQEYYQRYLNGEDTEELIAEILLLYQKTKQEMGHFQMDLSLDACREKIIYRLISGEKNSKRLENVPFIPFLDMVITFHVLLMEDEDGIGSILVRDELQRQWGIDTKQLFQLAQENTMRLFPKRICSMEQMLQELIAKTGQMQEMLVEYFSDCQETEGYIDPWVVTNEKGINGAAVILYPGCLEELAKRCNGDYYILPSSIHECLVMSACYSVSDQRLEKMVQEVNENCVLPDEVLSDHAYHYSVQSHSLEVL